MTIFKYELTQEAFEVRIGQFTLRRIPYSDIEDVRPGYAIWNEHWTNPFSLRFVTIQRKTGVFKNFVINPQDPERFVSELKTKIGK